MMLRSTIIYPCKKKEADRLMKSLAPDTHRSDRSEADIAYKENAVRIEIQAKDISALRASFNSITKLLSVHDGLRDIK